MDGMHFRRLEHVRDALVDRRRLRVVCLAVWSYRRHVDRFGDAYFPLANMIPMRFGRLLLRRCCALPDTGSVNPTRFRADVTVIFDISRRKDS